MKAAYGFGAGLVAVLLTSAAFAADAADAADKDAADRSANNLPMEEIVVTGKRPAQLSLEDGVEADAPAADIIEIDPRTLLDEALAVRPVIKLTF